VLSWTTSLRIISEQPEFNPAKLRPSWMSSRSQHCASSPRSSLYSAAPGGNSLKLLAKLSEDFKREKPTWLREIHNRTVFATSAFAQKNNHLRKRRRTRVGLIVTPSHVVDESTKRFADLMYLNPAKGMHNSVTYAAV